MNQMSVWKQLTQLPFLQLYEKLVNSAMQMDVFSQLTEKITAQELAAKMGWHEANTGYLLNGLTAIGFVQKDGDLYQNSPEATSAHIIRLESSISFQKNTERAITGFTKKKIYMQSKSMISFTTKIIFWMFILWNGRKA